MIYEINEINQYLENVKLDKSKNTYISYKAAIDRLISFLNIQNFENVKSVTSRDLRNHQASMKKEGLSESSVNANIRPIRAMFNWFIENEFIEKSPVEKVRDLKVSKKLPVFLTEEEQQKIIAACHNDFDKLIVVLLLSTGVRREELSSLKLNDYNGTHIKVFGKGGKERSLALQLPVINLINKYIANNRKNCKSDTLLVSRLKKGISGDGIYKKIKSILYEAGLPEDRIEKISPHKFRHSFVANMLDSGADIYICQNALGHANIATTMIYAHMHDSTLDNAMRNQKSVI